MKNILLIAVVFVALSACSNYVCPTYANQNLDEKGPAVEQEDV